MKILWTMLLIGIVACNTSKITTTPAAKTTLVTLKEHTEYDTDSTLRVVYQVDPTTGKREGFYREYDALTDALLLEEVYKNGELEGSSTLYYPSGAISAVLNYKNGQLDGLVKDYYENGQLIDERWYQKDVLTGVLKAYYEDGGLRETVTYVNGVTEGPFKEYYINGQLKAVGTYTTQGEEESLENGLLLLYNEEGVLERRMACQAGQCCILWTLEDGARPPSGDLCQKIIEACNCR